MFAAWPPQDTSAGSANTSSRRICTTPSSQPFLRLPSSQPLRVLTSAHDPFGPVARRRRDAERPPRERAAHRRASHFTRPGSVLPAPPNDHARLRGIAREGRRSSKRLARAPAEGEPRYPRSPVTIRGRAALSAAPRAGTCAPGERRSSVASLRALAHRWCRWDSHAAACGRRPPFLLAPFGDEYGLCVSRVVRSPVPVPLLVGFGLAAREPRVRQLGGGRPRCAFPRPCSAYYRTGALATSRSRWMSISRPRPLMLVAFGPSDQDRRTAPSAVTPPRHRHGGERGGSRRDRERPTISHRRGRALPADHFVPGLSSASAPLLSRRAGVALCTRPTAACGFPPSPEGPPAASARWARCSRDRPSLAHRSALHACGLTIASRRPSPCSCSAPSAAHLLRRLATLSDRRSRSRRAHNRPADSSSADAPLRLRPAARPPASSSDRILSAFRAHRTPRCWCR